MNGESPMRERERGSFLKNPCVMRRKGSFLPPPLSRRVLEHWATDGSNKNVERAHTFGMSKDVCQESGLNNPLYYSVAGVGLYCRLVFAESRICKQ